MDPRSDAAAARAPLTLMTTRRFARLVNEWGIDVDAVEALERVADKYDLKPATFTEIESAGSGK